MGLVTTLRLSMKGLTWGVRPLIKRRGAGGTSKSPALKITKRSTFTCGRAPGTPRSTSVSPTSSGRPRPPVPVTTTKPKSGRSSRGSNASSGWPVGFLGRGAERSGRGKAVLDPGVILRRWEGKDGAGGGTKRPPPAREGLRRGPLYREKDFDQHPDRFGHYRRRLSLKQHDSRRPHRLHDPSGGRHRARDPREAAAGLWTRPAFASPVRCVAQTSVDGKSGLSL